VVEEQEVDKYTFAWGQEYLPHQQHETAVAGARDWGPDIRLVTVSMDSVGAMANVNFKEHRVVM